MQSPQQQSAGQPPASRWQRYRPAMLRSLGLLLAAAVLLFLSGAVTAAPCWGVFALLVLVAFPIWQYRTEYLLFRRRLVLAGAARPASRVRALFWKGAFTRGVQAVVSLLLAWLLLALLGMLTPLHWPVLVADAIFLALLVGPVTRRLQADIRARHTGVVARRWPLFLLNGIVLCAALMAIDFFVAGAADTRRMDWSQVAEQAFSMSADAAGCVLWGIGSGTLAALEALAWHLSELLIPNLPDVSARIIAWAFFLLRTAALAWVYTALLLGICVLLDRREARRADRTTESLFWRSFLLTIILLALPFFYASVRLNEFHFDETGQAVALDCKPDAARRAQLLNELDQRVAAEHQQAIAGVDTAIEQGLEQIFADIEAGVDGYLDWYFTVTGEYQRLAAVFTTDVATAMSAQLEDYLFARSGFADRLDSLEDAIESASAERFAGIAPSIGARLENVPCALGSLDLAPLVELDRDSLRASTALASGAGAGIVASKVLAKKTAAAVVGKVAAKKSFQAGAAVVTKTLAKKGTSTALSAGLGLTLCAPAGPVAILCGVTAGLATWLAVDKALVEIDEAINREEMRADILEALAGQRLLLSEQLREKHHARVDRLAGQVNDALQRVFIPYRDGMGSAATGVD